MPTIFRSESGRLVCRFNGETIRLEPWGPDALRVRARPGRDVRPAVVEALLLPPPIDATITCSETRARIANGRIAAEVTLVHRYGADVKHELLIRYSRADSGAELLAETRSHFAGPGPRGWRPLASESWRLEAQFKAYDGERLYGLGQPQHGHLDLKGVSTTLMQQNTHVVIPFVLSSRGYGFLWHNPAVGRCEFAKNVTRWTADATSQLDYWIVAGDTPAAIMRRYVDATGHAPAFPEWASGFWQCKLRYRTQDELLGVAREYKRRGLPLSCIVIDFFHWTRQGEWKFDARDWPDPKAMMRELEKLGVKTMISIWPTVSASSEHYKEMRELGYLMRTERGQPVVIPFPDKDPRGVGFFTYYDATLPEARAYHWDIVRRNYLAHGIDNFWLDACEPEMRPAHPDNVRVALGNGAEVLSAYQLLHAQGYRDGLAAAGKTSEAVLLCRSAWIGAQRHGVILWSGDVWSSWSDFRAQIRAGLSAAISGISWWTHDIGGFFDGIGKSPEFRELLVRWFEFGVFSPICRLHGVRIPDALPLPNDGVPTYGSDTFAIFTDTGGANEVWSYGEEIYALLVDLLRLRERIRPYVMREMKEYETKGDPMMRPLFYDFPDDPEAWRVEDCYLFGRELLVSPVTEPGATRWSVYLPGGARWTDAWTGSVHDGGARIEVDAPLGRIPVFQRDAARQPIKA
jgi:alpha-D-xyloside xylohydrolase